MSDKLSRLADVLRDHGKAWNVALDTPRDSLVNEGVMAQDCLRAELLLRTLAPVLAKCEGAMEELIGNAADAMRDANRDGGEYDITATLAEARTALAELREVGA